MSRLYAALGSPRLGQLIKEEYRPVGEVKDAPDAAKVRKLVLERLPLFLHERNQTRVLIRPEWMQNTSYVLTVLVSTKIDYSPQEFHCQEGHTVDPAKDPYLGWEKSGQRLRSIRRC